VDAAVSFFSGVQLVPTVAWHAKGKINNTTFDCHVRKAHFLAVGQSPPPIVGSIIR
jgi:hypothetical protein